MEAFAAKREKSVFRNLFGANSDSSLSSSESEDDTEKSNHLEGSAEDEQRVTVFTSSSSTATIKLLEQKSLGIAHQLWPAAKFMCNYFEENINLLTSNSGTTLNIIELGAGVGLCGLFLADFMAKTFPGCAQKVILTDLLEAVDRLNLNIKLNKLEGRVSADVLSWGNEVELDAVFARFDSPPLIIAADCVYWECLFQPLVTTLKALTDRGCEVIIAHVKRWKKDAKFFVMCRQGGMSVEVLVEAVEMVPAEHTNIPTRQITRMYRIRKQQV